MNEFNRKLKTRHRNRLILATLISISVAGCFPKPNKANIALRKEVQSLSQQVADLESRHKANQAQIASLEANRTIPTLPNEKLQRLFTASGLKFKNLTIGQDLDKTRPGDEGFKICVTPLDQFGEEFKSAGSLRVELFDLAAKEPRLGEWSFDTAQTQRMWLSTPVIDGYVLTFPWQTAPTNAALIVKATFTEELTGRVFSAQDKLSIDLPAK